MNVDPSGARARLPGSAPREPQDRLRAAAEEFESVFLAQTMREMLSSASSSSSEAENPFSSMLQDEYAKTIARRGGLGIAQAIIRNIPQGEIIEHARGNAPPGIAG